MDGTPAILQFHRVWMMIETNSQKFGREDFFGGRDGGEGACLR